MKKKILIIMGRYLPGYKDGGPVRSIKNLTDYLGNEYDFYILTCDRDHGDKEQYKNIKVNEWNKIGNALVYYVRPGQFNRKLIVKLSNESDLVYLCGCFNDYAINTLVANRLNQIKVPVVIAAMGLFSPNAFKIKYVKKKIFVTVFNCLGMFKKVYWSVTSLIEANDIKRQIKVKKEAFYVAEDLPRLVSCDEISKKKEKNNLEIVWISRIAEKKNLLGAIKILEQIKSDVVFDIYGPIHEKKYWDKCLGLLNKLPANIKYHYCGILESENVVKTLKKYHVFLFPTLGENYGHVIQEALSAGCPCILSDQTPWKDLEEKKAGFVLPLHEISKFVDAIEYYAKMDEKNFNSCVFYAHDYALKNSNNKKNNTGYRKIFDTIIHHGE